MLNPGQIKGVTYQISNPQDLATLYYVQCVVRNSVTLATITIINLASKGNGLYVGSYSVPQDSTGVGYELFETVSVYTDSGYTLLSPNYSIVNTPYDVRFQLTAGTFGGANAGAYQPDKTDYEFIRKIIVEELAEILGKIPKAKEFDSSYLQQAMRMLGDGLTKGMKTHREEMTKLLETHKEETGQSLKSLSGSITSVGDSVSKIPLSEVVDILAGQISELQKKHETSDKITSEILKHHKTVKETQEKMHESLKSEMHERFDKHAKQTADTLSDYFSSVDTMIVNKGIPPPEKKQHAYDFLADVKKYNLI